LISFDEGEPISFFLQRARFFYFPDMLSGARIALLSYGRSSCNADLWYKKWTGPLSMLVSLFFPRSVVSIT